MSMNTGLQRSKLLLIISKAALAIYGSSPQFFTASFKRSNSGEFLSNKLIYYTYSGSVDYSYKRRIL